MTTSIPHKASFPRPHGEADRLRVARGLRALVDSPQGARSRATLDALCELARDVLAADHVFLGLMLEHELQVLAGANAPREAIPREYTFCAHTVATGAPVVVEDANDDSRFAKRRVWPPEARFYAGVPLTFAGQTVGTFCIADAQPRPWPQSDQRQLERLAQLASETLSLVAENHALRDQEVVLRQSGHAQLQAEADRDRALLHDAVTGVPNQLRLMAALDEMCDAERPGLLVLVGLDRFKTVNEFTGRAEGDAVLRAVGTRLAGELQNEATVGRLGGDEFGVVMVGRRTGAEVLKLAERIARVVEQASTINSTRPALGASLGIATFPADGDTSFQLLQSAEIALRNAKSNGGRQAGYFTPELRERIETKASMLREVAEGVRCNEFLLHYQPICTAEGVGRGFEGLMRWQHPERGLLGPYHFMAAFEDPTLSLRLGDLALTQAIWQMRAWRLAGLDFGYVAVNLSGAQLAEGDLAGAIERRLREAEVDPRYLMLEITESVYLDGKRDTIRNTLHALRELGVSFALDDFGTGYASLSHLLEIEVDRIKVDQSFVKQIGRGTGTDAIVRAVMTLGQALDLQVVAEGVETAEQLAFLRGLGCDLIQGYYFARPMDAESARRFCAPAR